MTLNINYMHVNIYEYLFLENVLPETVKTANKQDK